MNKALIKNGLYAITPHQQNTNKLLSQVEQALLGGIALLQFRDKTSSTQDKFTRAIALHELCLKHDTPLIINDDAELALACHAEGVHLGQTDGSIQHARELLGNRAIIGVTCHHQLELAIQAEDVGANYVAFGRFFSSNSKPGKALATLELLNNAKNQLSLPIVAIGGITLDTASPLIEAGANQLAAIEDIFAQQDIRTYCQQFSRLFNAHKAELSG